MPLRAAVAALTLMLAATPATVAQAQGTPAQKAPAQMAMPDQQSLTILIHNAVIAVSHANLTGNYTVLHALAAPGFQQANPPEKLAQLFANMRAVNLTPVVIFSPILTQQPVINEANMLHLTGYYNTAPQQVHFDLLFQLVGRHWQLFGVAVKTVPTQPRQPVASAKPPLANPPATAAAPEKKAPAVPVAEKRAREVAPVKKQ